EHVRVEWGVKSMGSLHILTSSSAKADYPVFQSSEWRITKAAAYLIARSSRAMTVCDQPLAVIPCNFERPHRAGRFPVDRYRQKMFGAALRGALDQNLARRAGLRYQPPPQRRLAPRAQSLAALPDLV